MLPLLALLPLPAIQAPAPPADPFAALAFLEGQWVGEAGQPGSSGSFSLERALGGQVLLRKNRTILPGPDGKPQMHEDLMVVYREQVALKAEYWDNEGHLIHYAVECSPAQVRMQSSGPGPRFRLSYLRTGEDSLEIRFEIAPPDKPEQFKVYQSGKARRVKP